MAPYYAWAGAVMPATGAKAGSSGRHDGSRTGTRPGMDGAVEEADGMRRVTARRVSACWGRGC